jgi:6-phosphogluconolactonase
MFVAGITGAVAASALTRPVAAAESTKTLAYFGTYTQGKSQGVYVAEFDTATGKLGEAKLAAKVSQPSFVAIHPSGKYVYTCNETDNFNGEKAGGLTAYAVQADGTLQELNQKSSIDAGPCHLVVDKAGKNVLAANYGGGSVCAYSLKENGELKDKTAFIQHQGTSVDKGRQEAPHAHSINLDAANRFAFVADLGLDKILIYKFDAETGSLTPNDPPFAATPKGGGPRHFAFHPSGKYAFVCNEMLSSVTSFRYDAAQGKLTEIETLSTLPQATPGNSTAEVQVHPSGKFVYVSNRGHNSIAIFQFDAEAGKLKSAGNQGEGIAIPRNFGIDPSGKWMVVCNQASDSVISFAIDSDNGSLSPTGSRIEVGMPVCVKFLAAKRS